MVDTNTVVRAYLAANAGLIALVGTRIYCPRMPHSPTAPAALPAVSFFTRGGINTPYIPDLLSPSKQFDCWADDPIEARQIYRALYDALQGLQNVKVTIGATDYYIKSAIEEVAGQDLVDSEIQNYYRVLSFWEIMVT